VNTDGAPAFNGQIFFNPGAGTLGVLQRRMFDGPWTFTIDMRLKKAIPITETKKVELAHGCHQRAQPPHVLERRSEHQLHHLRRDELHVLSAARGAVRGALHILMPPLWEQLSGARVYDLGQPYFTGMPHWPAHPPFLFGLTKRHGDMVGPAGHSSAADAMALGSHVGTHIDALCHFSCGGMLHGGHAVEICNRTRAAWRSFGGHGRAHPAARRAAGCGWAYGGGGPLAEDCEITPEQLEAARRRRSGAAMWCCCAPDGRATSRTRGGSSTRRGCPVRAWRRRGG
jgi:hypothetical protein